MSNVIRLTNLEDSDKVCIFKCINDAKAFVQETKFVSDDDKYEVICVESEQSGGVVDELIQLCKQYNLIVFILDENNFDNKELTQYSHHINKIFYQSQRQDKKLEFAVPNFMSSMLNNLKDIDSSYFGMDVKYGPYHKLNKFIDFYTLNNTIITIYTKKLFGTFNAYYRASTNYSFEINKKIILIDEYNNEEHDLEIKVTDRNNNICYLELPANKKNNLEYFRQILMKKGNYFDCFTKAEFTQLMFNLCSFQTYPTVYKYNRPGLIADKKVWLLADEVIKLED